MEGQCEKKTDKYFSWWNQRYLVLDRHKLRYFADKNDKKNVKLQKGFFDLRHIESLHRDDEVEEHVILHITFRTERKKRTVLLKFKIDDYDGWLAIFSSYYDYVHTPEGPHGRQIPIPLNFAEGMWACLDRLEKIGAPNIEGLFRKAGAERSCNKLEHALLFDGALKAKWPNYEAHDVSQVFSRLLGNLPEGILTASAWSDWNHARDLTDIKQCLSIIPPLNRIILQKLFSLLKILSSNPDTKMDIKALQIVFGVLMHHQDYTSTSVVMIPNLTDMFTILIEQYDECFPDPISKFSTRPTAIFSNLALVPKFNRYRDTDPSPRTVSEHYRRRSENDMRLASPKVHTKSHDAISMKDQSTKPLSTKPPHHHPHRKKGPKSERPPPQHMSWNHPLPPHQKLARKAKTMYHPRSREPSAMSVVSAESTPARIGHERYESKASDMDYRHPKEKTSYIHNYGGSDYDEGKDYSEFDEFEGPGMPKSSTDYSTGKSKSSADYSSGMTTSEETFRRVVSAHGKNVGSKKMRTHDQIDERDLWDLMNLEEEVLAAKMRDMSSGDLRRFLKVAIYQISISEDREQSFVYNIKDLQQQIDRLSQQNQMLKKRSRNYADPRRSMEPTLPQIPDTTPQRKRDSGSFRNSISTTLHSFRNSLFPKNNPKLEDRPSTMDLQHVKGQCRQMRADFAQLRNHMEDSFRAFESEMNAESNRIFSMLRRSSEEPFRKKKKSNTLLSHMRTVRHDSNAVIDKVCDFSNRISMILDSVPATERGLQNGSSRDLKQFGGSDFHLSL